MVARAPAILGCPMINTIELLKQAIDRVFLGKDWPSVRTGALQNARAGSYDVRYKCAHLIHFSSPKSGQCVHFCLLGCSAWYLPACMAHFMFVDIQCILHASNPYCLILWIYFTGVEAFVCSTWSLPKQYYKTTTISGLRGSILSKLGRTCNSLIGAYLKIVVQLTLIYTPYTSTRHHLGSKPHRWPRVSKKVAPTTDLESALRKT
jgi:hypothetical protein